MATFIGLEMLLCLHLPNIILMRVSVGLEEEGLLGVNNRTGVIRFGIKAQCQISVPQSKWILVARFLAFGPQTTCLWQLFWLFVGVQVRKRPNFPNMLRLLVGSSETSGPSSEFTQSFRALGEMNG
jgi:hypothetical protein